MPLLTGFPFSAGGLSKATVTGTTGSPTIDTSSRPGKTIYKFTGSGTITIGTAGIVEMLIVAGGGSGAGNYNSGQSYGMGGGAGGAVLYKESQYLEAGTYTVSVGAGGATNSGISSRGCVGTESIVYGNGIPMIIAPGGDMGASAPNGTTAYSYGLFIAGSGGAGAPGGTGPASTPKYTNIGKQGGSTNFNGAGGGGGAGTVGGNAGPGYVSGNGGDGLAYSTVGVSTYYGGGGGGGVNGTPGAGGNGGGGAGRGSSNGPATSGQANTGGGGGGNNAVWGGAPGQGGSGLIVIVTG